MRWILLSLLMFLAVDLGLLYTLALYVGEWALVAAIVVPWIFRAPLVMWARRRAVVGNPNDLSSMGDQFILTAASIGFMLPGLLLRVVALSLLSRRVRARVRAFAGKKAAEYLATSSPNRGGYSVGDSFIFTQMYGSRMQAPGPIVQSVETLKRADGREVERDVTALPGDGLQSESK